MSTRDELAGIIMSPESFDGGPASCGPGSVYAARIADAILAAGYRKPRTIATVEELDALGRTATILDSEEHVWTNDGDTLDQWGSVTRAEAYGGPMWFGSADIPLPATVLYEPEATK